MQHTDRNTHATCSQARTQLQTCAHFLVLASTKQYTHVGSFLGSFLHTLVAAEKATFTHTCEHGVRVTWCDMTFLPAFTRSQDYKTMYPWFMESVWWVFQEIFNKDMVYRGCVLACMNAYMPTGMLSCI